MGTTDHSPQGLELDESDDNPFANTDGFYPVRPTL